MLCTKISAEFEFGGHSPLVVHPQKCGFGIRRWENHRRLFSFRKCSHKLPLVLRVPGKSVTGNWFTGMLPATNITGNLRTLITTDGVIRVIERFKLVNEKSESVSENCSAKSVVNNTTPSPDWNCQWGPSGARSLYPRHVRASMLPKKETKYSYNAFQMTSQKSI